MPDKKKKTVVMKAKLVDNLINEISRKKPFKKRSVYKTAYLKGIKFCGYLISRFSRFWRNFSRAKRFKIVKLNKYRV